MGCKQWTRRSSRLARLSSTEQKHLNLIFGHYTVLLELALDLVISCDGATSMRLDVCRKLDRESN